MASIVKRGNSFAVVYGYKNKEGVYKQKWETYHSEEHALKRKEELENPITTLRPSLKIDCFDDLLDEYIQLHGQLKWSYHTYDSRTRLCSCYIRPVLGKVSIARIDRHLLSRFFAGLKVNSLDSPTSITLFEIYKLLHSVFQQAAHWGYFQENLMSHIKLKAPFYPQRKTLSPGEIACAINYALAQQDLRSAILIHLAFSCSMRKGEILGLCWEDIDFANGTISVSKELARVSKKGLNFLGTADVYHTYPCRTSSKSQLVLKAPKTSSSIRTVYMSSSLAILLSKWRDRLCDFDAAVSGPYHLVLTQGNGHPLCPRKCNRDYNALLSAAKLPETTFHSLRHSSTAYKLILSGGNIKAVQGDTGHAQPRMVLSIYAKVNNHDRRQMAEELESDFCSKLISYI